MKNHYTAVLVAASAMMPLAPPAAHARPHAHPRLTGYVLAHTAGLRLRSAYASAYPRGRHIATQFGIPIGMHNQTRAIPARLARHAQAPGDRAGPVGWLRQSGTASHYSAAYDGRRAASGRIFRQNGLTAAHAWLPFGTRVLVTCAATGRSVVVTIIGRLYAPGRVLDLSRAAAAELDMIQRGIAIVTLEPARS
jgi:rare lipoprotein A